MILAIEDALSEAVARKMVAAVRSDLVVSAVIGLCGNGYLKARARELNRTARSQPVMLLTDLDSPIRCAPELIADWLDGKPQPNLLFRVAVMEVESWVLADRSEMALLLGVPEHRIPADTDSLAHPKEFIVNLARRSRSKRTREEMVPALGSTAKEGPFYNPLLTSFVQRAWSPRRASGSSPSLSRALARLRAAFSEGR